MDLSQPPIPPDASPSEVERIEHMRLRRRVMTSAHREDVITRIRAQFGLRRSVVFGEPDMTANPPLSIYSQVAILYREEPAVLAELGSEAVADAARRAGLWPRMQRVQRDTLGLRHMLLHVALDDRGEPTYTPLYPDLVSADPDPERPTEAVRVRVARPTVEHGWCWHTWDIRDPAAPTYRVFTAASGADVTSDVLGVPGGPANYPARWADGRPYIPIGWYRAADSGWLWDPYTYREVFEGALNVAMLLTYYQHLVRNAAFALRYTIGVYPKGMETTGEGETARAEHDIDPTVVWQLAAEEGATNPQVGQFTPPVDPASILESIAQYERRIMLLAGVAPADVTRQEADIRSGYSLAVARESVREAQSLYEPLFRHADQRVLAMTAALLNRANNTGYSEDPESYRIAYRGLGETPQELDARLAQLRAKQEAGMVGPVSAYLEMHPQATRQEAISALASVATEKADVEAAIAERVGVSDAQPQTTPLSPGAMQTAQLVLVAAASGQMQPDTAREFLASVVGIPPAAADKLARTLKPAPTPEATP